MNAKASRTHRRNWSLSLIAILLLHGFFGACAAFADTLCVEPDGKIAWEHIDGPCASDAVEKITGKPCVDLTLDAHDNHTPVPSKVIPLLASQAILFIPALNWLLPTTEQALNIGPDTTGPPSLAAHSVTLRKTTVLLI